MQTLEVNLWDVGQGDCSTITLPDGSLIIIDVGPRGSPLLDWLNDRPRDIFALVLTHNDMDHVGSLPALVGAFGSRIRNFYMLVDRAVNDPKFATTFRCALEGEDQGFYTITRLERGVPIWQDAGLGAQLAVMFPTLSGNVRGIATGPNDTSGIVQLQLHGKTEFIWPGDSPLSRLAEQCANANPLLQVGPHHGAPKGYKAKSAGALIEAVKPRRAFLSVGTKNKFSHPRQRYILRLELAGCHVACSQMTQICDREVVAGGKSVFPSHFALALRPPRRGVSCRGAMQFRLNGATFDPDGLDQEHLQRIRSLRRAMCLRGRGFRSLFNDARPRRYRT